MTLGGRRPEKLEAAVAELDGGEHVISVAGNMADEETIKKLVARHRERFGRLDLLVNNAGVGIGAPVAEIETKRLDMQLDVNLRSIFLFYRECVDLLRAAAAEHHNAIVVNTASISGKIGRGVAIGLLGHQARRGRLHRGDEQGARRRGDQVMRAVPGLRRHPDDRLRQGQRRRRGR